MAWLSLAEEDDDPARFCRQLIEALGEAVPQLGDDAQTYLQNTMRVPVVAVIESLLGDLDRYARPLLLVLDDLHLVSNPDIFTGLNRLVQYAPPGLVLALGTRSQPALSLATWRAKGLLLEIGLEELRLGFEETREYLERSGLYLDEPCLKALYGQTEGWVVGVHLVSLWLRQQPQVQEMALLDGDKQAVSAYLLAAVFERLPGDLQEALLALGVASQLSGDLANALTGRQDGQALLERLESMQLFLLPLDRERQWYRFHLLFADFLRNRLRDSDPDRFQATAFQRQPVVHQPPHADVRHRACLCGGRPGDDRRAGRRMRTGADQPRPAQPDLPLAQACAGRNRRALSDPGPYRCLVAGQRPQPGRGQPDHRRTAGALGRAAAMGRWATSTSPRWR